VAASTHLSGYRVNQACGLLPSRGWRSVVNGARKQTTYAFVFLEITPSPARDWVRLKCASFNLLVEFFATDPHFLFCDGEDNPPRQRAPFFFELFYGLLPVAVTLSLSHSFVSVLWSLLSYWEQHFPSGRGSETKDSLLQHPFVFSRRSGQHVARTEEAWLFNFEICLV
jgi:hypothetical protein